MAEMEAEAKKAEGDAAEENVAGAAESVSEGKREPKKEQAQVTSR